MQFSTVFDVLVICNVSPFARSEDCGDVARAVHLGCRPCDRATTVPAAGRASEGVAMPFIAAG